MYLCLSETARSRLLFVMVIFEWHGHQHTGRHTSLTQKHSGSDSRTDDSATLRDEVTSYGPSLVQLAEVCITPTTVVKAEPRQLHVPQRGTCTTYRLTARLHE